MSDAQYWAWFWKHITVWLPISIPFMFAAIVWVIIQWYGEQHEDDPPKEHYTKLFGGR